MVHLSGSGWVSPPRLQAGFAIGLPSFSARLQRFAVEPQGFSRRLRSIDARLLGFGRRLPEFTVEGWKFAIKPRGFSARLRSFDARLPRFNARLQEFSAEC